MVGEFRVICRNGGNFKKLWGDTRILGDTDIWYIVNNANGVDFVTFTFWNIRTTIL